MVDSEIARISGNRPAHSAEEKIELRFSGTEVSDQDPNSEEFIQDIRSRLGIPSDFDAWGYITRNPDLWHFESELQAYLHYSKDGRNEGRVWLSRPDFEFYRKLYAEETRDLSRSELGRHWELHRETCYASMNELLRSAGFKNPEWLKAFDAQSYVVYNNLQAAVGNEVQAIAHFVETGIPNLLAISADLEFDATFRRALFGCDRNLSDSDLYRDWLQNGLSRNEPANERHLLRNWNLNLSRIPDGFLWREYLSNRPNTVNVPRTKWHLFEHFVHFGCLEEGMLPLSVECRVDVLLRLADRFVLLSRPDDADRLYERIILLGDDAPRAIQHAGDNAFRAGQYARALRLYDRVRRAGAASFWTYYNAAESSRLIGETEGAFSWVEEGLQRYPRSRTLLYVHGLLAQRFLDIAIHQHIESLRDPHNFPQSGLQKKIRQLFAVFKQKYELQFSPPPDEPRSARERPLRVSILANKDLPQCTYYRVEQKKEQLELAGLQVEIYGREDVASFRSAASCADVAILYRLAASCEVLDSIAYCRANGVPVLYEIDDLVFDPGYFPEPIASYDGAITPDQHFELSAGVELVLAVIGLCDGAIASTRHLAARLGEIVGADNVIVHRNGLSSELAKFARTKSISRFEDDRLVIFYGSGTKAHALDFQNLVVPALFGLMEENKNVYVRACGFVDVERLAENFPTRVEHIDLVADRQAYYGLFRDVDINISVLSPGIFNDCKSEIKWLEAAAFGIPTIVSDVGVYREVCEDGRDLILAQNSSESWSAGLRRLVQNGDLRREIGEAARAKALELFDPDGLGVTLGKELVEVASAKGLYAKFPSRKKILYVNVFFAPQAIGGATRVVIDEVRRLSRDFPEYEPAVLCGNDDPGPDYQMESYWIEGVRVFSINTPRREHMDWLAADTAVSPMVERVLDFFQPDLVHFHATQRLGFSVIKAVQRREIPYVVTVHDAWWISDHQFLMDRLDRLRYPWESEQFSTPSNPYSREESAARRFLLAGALSGAASVFAVSKSFSNIYRQAGVSAIETLENGVPDLPPLIPAAANHGKVRLGHIGGMTYHKGFFILKQALMRNGFPGLELVAVDHSMNFGEERWEQWGDTSVRIVGKIPQKSIGTLYGLFDVLVATSTWPESYGLVSREALAYGKWVIASERGAISEVVIHGLNGFIIDIADPKALINVLSEIQSEPGKYRASPRERGSLRSLDDHIQELTGKYSAILGGAESSVQESAFDSPGAASRPQVNEARRRSRGRQRASTGGEANVLR